MNDSALVPETVSQLREIVAEHPKLLAVGRQTKPPLSRCEDVTLISLCGLHGMIQYEPSEFTFTAQAGTPVSEIAAILAERRQYLPFDPLLVDAGATLGGTVAAGMSGSGRYRYGGIRDFLLGVQFISGDANLITAGGKVVKNAAGFDIPKLLVGSLGRLGVITELTFKVFPQPLATQTLTVQCENDRQATTRICEAASRRWELDAIDYLPSERLIHLRLAGPPQVNTAIAGEVRGLWGSDVTELPDAESFWTGRRELQWAPQTDPMVKIPGTPSTLLDLQQWLAEDAAFQSHWAVAGNVMWVAVANQQACLKLSDELTRRQVSGLLVRGDQTGCLVGRRPANKIETAIQQAMDPPDRFADVLTIAVQQV